MSLNKSLQESFDGLAASVDRLIRERDLFKRIVIAWGSDICKEAKWNSSHKRFEFTASRDLNDAEALAVREYERSLPANGPGLLSDVTQD